MCYTHGILQSLIAFSSLFFVIEIKVIEANIIETKVIEIEFIYDYSYRVGHDSTF